MGTCIKIFIFCYLLFYPHYAYAFDHVTIVNEDSIDKEFDVIMSIERIYFSQHLILMLAMELCMNILELSYCKCILAVCIKVFTHTT